MTWRESQAPGIQPLTQEFAQTFAAMEPHPGDRSILRDKTWAGKRRVAWLQSKLEDGAFFTPVWSVATISGKTYRVDGGHSSWMLANCNSSFPEGMFVIVRHFQCDTDEDFADLFMQFDPRRSLRTYSEKVRANKAARLELADISPTDVTNAIRGVAWYLSQTNGDDVRMDEDERVRLMHKYSSFVLWASHFVRYRPFRRTGVIAAMFGTSNRDREAAHTFYGLVKTEAATDPASPTRKFATFLRDSIADNLKGPVKKWDSRAFYVKNIHFWNAWREGRTSDGKYHPNTPLPKIK